MLLFQSWKNFHPVANALSASALRPTVGGGAKDFLVSFITNVKP